MNHQNSVLLEGVLVTDPEVAAVCRESDRRLIKFVLANDRYYMDKNGQKQKDTLFMAIECWGGLGEKCLKTMKKGMTARCVGRLMSSTWTGKNGDKRITNMVLCKHLEYQVKPYTKEGRVEEIQILEDTDNESQFLSETVVLYEF